MNLAEFNTRLRSEVGRYKEGFRNPSTAFLMWFLVNFFRISVEDAKDAICDEQGDKGIDGMWVDETSDEEEIYIFQSKYSPTDDANQGDVDLRNFVGATSWFDSPESVQRILESTANKELKSLVERLRIKERVTKGCQTNAIFITNKTFDSNAKEFLDTNRKLVEGFDQPSIFAKYTYVAEEEAVCGECTLNVTNPTFIECDILSGVSVLVLPLQVKELLKLDGIKDFRLFARNVRYGLGKTRVNKDITNTLKKGDEHSKFFLYHNGIAIVCEELIHETNSVKVTNYSVVNGCQSMLTFYENADSVSDRVYVLTKIIKIPSGAPVSVEDITYWANNQNAISVRDLKANDVIQRALKNEFERLFGGKVLYRRQKGDSAAGYDKIIERDFAAQLIAAFYLGEPRITYLRNELFTDRYYDIFSININAAKIYLSNVIHEVIVSNVEKIKFEQIRNYGLARFLLLHIVGELLKRDSKGKEILGEPESWIKEKNLEVLKVAVAKLFQLVVFDIDNFIQDWMRSNDGFFDYKNFFKNTELTQKMTQEVITAYGKQLVHHPEDEFNKIYSKCEL